MVSLALPNTDRDHGLLKLWLILQWATTTGFNLWAKTNSWLQQNCLDSSIQRLRCLHSTSESQQIAIESSSSSNDCLATVLIAARQSETCNRKQNDINLTSKPGDAPLTKSLKLGVKIDPAPKNNSSTKTSKFSFTTNLHENLDTYTGWTTRCSISWKQWGGGLQRVGPRARLFLYVS